MEYFADAVAAQTQKLDGTAKEEVIAAAGALFKEEPEDEDHPVGTKRIARIESCWDKYGT